MVSHRDDPPIRLHTLPATPDSGSIAWPQERRRRRRRRRRKKPFQHHFAGDTPPPQNYHSFGIGHETHVPPRQALVGGGVTRVSPSRGFRLMRTRGPWRLAVDSEQEWTRVSRNRRLIQRRTGHPSPAPFRRSVELACLSVGVAARIEVVLGIPSVPIQFSVFF